MTFLEPFANRLFTSTDLSKINSKQREKYIRLGLQFGSQDTLDQANQTLGALSTHASLLQNYGFGPKQLKNLEDARDGLQESGVGREAAKGQKKVNGLAYVNAMNKGEFARIWARTLLIGAAEDLEGSETAADLLAIQSANAALLQSRVAADKAEPLAQQLQLLLGALKEPTIAAMYASIGGPEAVSRLESAIGALRAADQEDVGVRGTPVETATLDLLDGIIVSLVRRARRAAVAAAKETGNAALVDTFRLDKLYKHRSAEPAAPEPEAPNTPAAPEK